MREWSVLCEWCDAKPGEPCRDLNGNAYPSSVHRPRDFLYRWEHGLSVPKGWHPQSLVKGEMQKP